MRQRLDEWLEGCDWDFHEKQYRTTYRITVHFCDWLDKELRLSAGSGEIKVLDIGAGMGANIHYMSQRFPVLELTGVEINSECVRRGSERLRELGANRCSMESGDLFALPREWVGRFSGVVSFATLSWLPTYHDALGAFADLKPEWMAVTSLFYDGPVDTTITTRDYSRPHASAAFTEKFYNIYSLDLFRTKLESLGYSIASVTPFEIDIDLPRPVAKGMGTYTEKLADGRRLQISASLIMPWYFVLATRVANC